MRSHIDWRRERHQLERGSSVNETLSPEGGWIVRAHIGRGGEVDYEIPHRLGKRTKHSL